MQFHFFLSSSFNEVFSFHFEHLNVGQLFKAKINYGIFCSMKKFVLKIYDYLELAMLNISTFSGCLTNL